MSRPLWKGAISLGRVRIPVQMFLALKERDVRFHRMSPDGKCRLRTKLVCPESGEEYDLASTARGFEIAPDQYVIVSEAEVSALAPEAGRTIELEDFVSLDEIDPIYFDRPYYLGPGTGGQTGYRLLYEAMMGSRKVGIARFVLRTRQHLAAVRPALGGLVLSTMRYADEVEPFSVQIPEVPAVERRQLDLATRLIESMTVPFEPARYRDTVRDQLLELIERKAEGEQVSLPEQAEEQAEVVDLMQALQESLASTGAPPLREGTTGS